MAKKNQELRVKVKLTQRVEERPAKHLLGKGHLTNFYLTDSDEEAIVDFFRDHEELCDRTSEHFKDKTRKDCLWERFTSNHNVLVIEYKAWFESQRTC